MDVWAEIWGSTQVIFVPQLSAAANLWQPEDEDEGFVGAMD